MSQVLPRILTNARTYDWREPPDTHLASRLCIFYAAAALHSLQNLNGTTRSRIELDAVLHSARSERSLVIYGAQSFVSMSETDTAIRTLKSFSVGSVAVLLPPSSSVGFSNPIRPQRMLSERCTMSGVTVDVNFACSPQSSTEMSPLPPLRWTSQLSAPEVTSLEDFRGRSFYRRPTPPFLRSYSSNPCKIWSRPAHLIRTHLVIARARQMCVPLLSLTNFASDPQSSSYVFCLDYFSNILARPGFS